MRNGIETSSDCNQNKLYMYNMYHEWFWGPFDTPEEVAAAISHLYKVDPYWGYDPYMVFRGGKGIGPYSDNNKLTDGERARLNKEKERLASK